MTSYVTSTDGTRIAYDRLGDGPPVVVVSGIFCDRRTTQGLAERRAEHHTVYNYDRRGRGDSGHTPPYAVEREVEDIAALIAEAGGTASVYGHSSGAGLALHAAASELPITRLVLHEPPYGADDEDSKRSARDLAEDVRVALEEDRRADAIALFFESAGMPPEMIEPMSVDPGMQSIAPTMVHDFEIMGDATAGGTIPEENLTNYNVDRVKTLGESVLGLTLACAQCHDHKFDAITQKDYYRLYAFFNSTTDKPLDDNALLPPPVTRAGSDEDGEAQPVRVERAAEERREVEKRPQAPLLGDDPGKLGRRAGDMCDGAERADAEQRLDRERAQLAAGPGEEPKPGSVSSVSISAGTVSPCWSEITGATSCSRSARRG